MSLRTYANLTTPKNVFIETPFILSILNKANVKYFAGIITCLHQKTLPSY